jgi:hypothetical protein
VVLETDAGPTSVFRRLGNIPLNFSKPWIFSGRFFQGLERGGLTFSKPWKSADAGGVNSN